jgi:hypothetical protein
MPGPHPIPPPEVLLDAEAYQRWEREVLLPWRDRIAQRQFDRSFNGRETGPDRRHDEERSVAKASLAELVARPFAERGHDEVTVEELLNGE